MGVIIWRFLINCNIYFVIRYPELEHFQIQRPNGAQTSIFNSRIINFQDYLYTSLLPTMLNQRLRQMYNKEGALLGAPVFSFR